MTFSSSYPFWYDLLIYIIVPIFTLFYWRGTWILCDYYLYPSSTLYSGWISLGIGYIGLFFFFLFQYYGYVGHIYTYHLPSPSNSSNQNPSSLPPSPTLSFPSNNYHHSFLFYLTYFESYYIAFCVVNSWRGLWLLQDVYLLPSFPVLSPWISHILGVLILIIFKHFKSVYAPPVVYFTDYEYECTRLNYLKNNPSTTGSVSLPSHTRTSEINENDETDPKMTNDSLLTRMEIEDNKV